MVIWLRSPRGGIGISSDVLRATEFAQLLELDRASHHFEHRAEELLAIAQREADAMRQTVTDEGERVLQAAQTKYDNAARLGYEAGRRRALCDAHEAMLLGAAREHELMTTLRERIADMVMRTVTRVLGEADREALFAQIAVSISRSLEGASFLTVRVAASDADHASRAFRRACEEHRWPINPEVVSDAAALPGSCVCEWDHGLVEAGLPAQLRAIECAIRRVARSDPGEGGGDGADVVGDAGLNADTGFKADAGAHPHPLEIGVATGAPAAAQEDPASDALYNWPLDFGPSRYTGAPQ